MTLCRLNAPPPQPPVPISKPTIFPTISSEELQAQSQTQLPVMPIENLSTMPSSRAPSDNTTTANERKNADVIIPQANNTQEKGLQEASEQCVMNELRRVVCVMCICNDIGSY